jgi:hypothetical protein
MITYTYRNNIEDDIIFQTSLDNRNCNSDFEIRFIEWKFIDENDGTDLGLGHVGKVGELYLPLNKEVVSKLPLNKNVLLHVKLTLSVQQIINNVKMHSKIVDTVDELPLKMVSSPIEIQLEGEN